MGVVQVRLPDELQTMIDQRVAKGEVASQADFLLEAVRIYADHLDAEDEIAAHDRMLLPHAVRRMRREP